MTIRQVLVPWVALVLPGVLLAVSVHFLPLSGLDVAISHAVQEARPVDAVLTPLMRAVSVPGDYPWAQLLFVVATLAPLAWWPWRASLLILSTVTGDAMVLTVQRVAAIVLIGFWFVIQLLDGVAAVADTTTTSGGGVAYWAHIGGFVFGLVVTLALSLGQGRASLRRSAGHELRS